MVPGDGDHDAAGRGVGAARAHGSVGRECLIRPVLVAHLLQDSRGAKPLHQLLATSNVTLDTHLISYDLSLNCLRLRLLVRGLQEHSFAFT